MDNVEKMADALALALQGVVARSLEPLLDRLQSVEARQPQKGEPGKDGTSVTAADVAPLISAAVTEGIRTLGATLKDGMSAYQLAVEAGYRGSQLEWLASLKGGAGEPGRDGREGEPGRDALEIEIRPAIDPERPYPRGTYAQLAGGIVRAARNTDPVKDGDYVGAGWVHVVRGVAGLAVEQVGERGFAFAWTFSDGSVERKSFSVPVMIDRGIWKPGPYEQGDVTTRDGSGFVAKRDTLPHEEPGDSSGAWRLFVKRGQNGKDGKDGARGAEGKEGKAGRDLTQLGFNGERH